MRRFPDSLIKTVCRTQKIRTKKAELQTPFFNLLYIISSRTYFPRHPETRPLAPLTKDPGTQRRTLHNQSSPSPLGEGVGAADGRGQNTPTHCPVILRRAPLPRLRRIQARSAAFQ